MSKDEALPESGETEKEERRIIHLQPSHMQIAEVFCNHWVANAPEGTTPDDVLRPEFWSLVSSRMKPFDHIEVRAFDGTWLLEGVVLMADRTWAKVHKLHLHSFTSRDVAMTQSGAFETKWSGPTQKWRLIRKSDGEVIRAGFDSKEEANRAMVEHERVTG